MRRKGNICGPIVRRLRLRRGWSAEQLASKVTAAGVKMSAKDVEAIESGEKCVLDHEVLAIARALSVSVQELLTGRGPKLRR